MSAAAARRRKQLEARKKQHNQDAVSLRLQELLESDDLVQEATAYEALQLAQSQVRKRIKSGDYKGATEMAYQGSLALLNRKRVSVASQLLTVLVEALRETHTDVSVEWIDRLVSLHQAHQSALDDTTEAMSVAERSRLERLEREFLRKSVQWTSELGTIRFGDLRLLELLGHQCWKLSLLATEDVDEDEEENSSTALQCDAVTQMVLAEKPQEIISWLKDLPKPTSAELQMGHTCPPSDRDGLLTRSLLLFCVVENLRDANVLLRCYMDQVEERDIADLTKSYMNKEDGIAPSHVVFGSMLLRTCEKDTKTGPLYSWLLRSFKRELNLLYKPQIIETYTTKIGKVYFNIQPPPSMLNMIEGMMGGMGGMGGAGMNPAMLQQMMAAQGGQM